MRGFLTAALLFCVGPMTILGSIQDGLSGDYTLLAWENVESGAWMDPDFLYKFESQGVKVSLSEGDKRTVTARVVER